MLWLDERCVHMRVCTKLDTKLLHCMCMHWSCKHEMRNRFGLMNTQSELTFLLTDETWKIFATVLYFSWLLNSQEEQGWHSGEDTHLSPMLPRFKSQPGYLICGLSLLFVLSLVLRGFTLGTPVFPSQRAKKLKN